MPAPYPRRGPIQGVARAVNRGSKGMAQGRFAGLSAVQHGTAGSHPVEPVPGGAFVGAAMQFYSTDSSIPSGQNGWEPTLTIGSTYGTAFATLSFGSIQFTQAGIYGVNVGVDLYAPFGAGEFIVLRLMDWHTRLISANEVHAQVDTGPSAVVSAFIGHGPGEMFSPSFDTNGISSSKGISNIQVTFVRLGEEISGFTGNHAI